MVDEVRKEVAIILTRDDVFPYSDATSYSTEIGLEELAEKTRLAETSEELPKKEFGVIQ